MKIIFAFTFCISTILLGNNSNVSCQQLSLPKPGGKYRAGTNILLFERIKKKDSLQQGTNRQLNVQVFYPADKSKHRKLNPYIYDSLLLAVMKKEEYLNLKDSVLDSWARLNTHSFVNAPYKQGKYPLIIISHGFGMSRINYTILAEEIASRGYISATIDHPSSGLTILKDGSTLGLQHDKRGPDGKVIEFCDDIAFVIMELLKNKDFKNSIDDKNIGILGHSLGGAAALNIGLYNSVIKAAINLDGYLFGKAMKVGVDLPFLSILQKPVGLNITDSMRLERYNEWKAIIAKSKEDALVINVQGMMHFDFSDLIFLAPDSVRLKNGGTLNANKAHKIVSSIVISFLNHYLKKGNKSHLLKVIGKYPEVSIEIKKAIN